MLRQRKPSTAKKTAPKRTGAPKKPTGERDHAEAMKSILRSVEKKIEKDTVKVTLADYIRLFQLQKELTPETPTEIRVMWIDPPLESSEE